MRQTKNYSFSDKKIILHSLNNGLINGYLEYENFKNFDKVFNTISISEIDLHILLFKIWNQEKELIRLIDDKDQLYKILQYINEQIDNIQQVNDIIKNDEIIKVLHKEKGESNE